VNIKINKYTIIFRPQNYGNVMLSLAECYGYDIKPDGIHCDIRESSREALYYFILNSVPYHARKDLFYKLKPLFASYVKAFDRFAKEKIPYYSKLYNHQKACLFFCFNKQYTLLALEQGLGI